MVETKDQVVVGVAEESAAGLQELATAKVHRAMDQVDVPREMETMDPDHIEMWHQRGVADHRSP